MIYILHISDLHFVKNALAYSTSEILRREAKEKVKNIPQGKKLLIVTGDFHNYNDKDYAKAEAFLKNLTDDMGLDMSKDVFLVPGNHDVGNDATLKLFLEKKDVNWKLHNDAAVDGLKKGDRRFLSERLHAFRPFSTFVQNLGIYSPTLEEDFPAQTHLRNWRGKLNILHLNTALIADGETKINQITDTDKAADPATWRDHNPEIIPAIAIAHNSYYDLKDECRTDLATAFSLWNVSAYLAGDRHRTEHDPEQQMIRLSSGHRIGDEIPNLVAAKALADRNDNYSEVGFCWHEWDEANDQVTVEFRKWTRESRAKTVSDGEPGEYVMRQAREHDNNDLYIKMEKRLKEDADRGIKPNPEWLSQVKNMWERTHDDRYGRLLIIAYCLLGDLISGNQCFEKLKQSSSPEAKAVVSSHSIRTALGR